MIDYDNISFENEYEKIDYTNLKIPKAKLFAETIFNSDSSILIDCYKVKEKSHEVFNPDDEIIVFETKIEIGQNSINDIRYTELLAVQFIFLDNLTPWVYALRKDFPNTSHINSMSFIYPKCLCIYEKLFPDLQLEWRSIKFLQDIRSWLKQTSSGTLHHQNQPLEPYLILNVGSIIFPLEFNELSDVYLYSISSNYGRYNFLASNLKIPSFTEDQSYLLIKLKITPSSNISLIKTPLNLFELNQIFINNDKSLYDILKEKFIEELKVLEETEGTKLKKKVIFLIHFERNNKDNESNYYTFITIDNIRDIGIKFKLWDTSPIGLGQIYPQVEPDIDHLKTSKLGILIYQNNLTKDKAFLYSNSKNLKEVNISQIGVGAIGSHIFWYSTKKGLGNWKIIDNDILLPHNLVRHALDSHYLLQSKSLALIQSAETLLNYTTKSKGLWVDYLSIEYKEQINDEIKDSDLIIDTSASLSVARYLSSCKDILSKRASIFINPTGQDLVILCEDKDRHYRLDILEHQYYRELYIVGELSNHFKSSNEEIRYAGGCGDITTKIAPEFITIHSSIASKQIEKIIETKKAFINIWRINEQTLEIKSLPISISNIQTLNKNGWEIIIDDYVLVKINKQRLIKLPNETGGILLGGYDLSRKIIYIVDTILSPDDSEEYPNSYIRGITGVKEKMEEISQNTMDHIKYIGEWHSHPKNSKILMSGDDKRLFKSIEKEMKPLGYPTLMLIIGDNEKFDIYMNI